MMTSSRGRASGASGGFTLLEVLVALVVVATAFVALLGLHNQNLKLVGRDQDLALATLAAREIMTRVEFEGFPDLGLSSGELSYPAGFYWELEVSEVSELPDIRRVVVRVTNDPARPGMCELVYYARNRNEDELF
jgi:general secretion pathway protein I